MIDTAVILAGGLGTRLRPLTYEIPKPLIPIQGITLTEHVINKLKEAGVSKFYLSIGYMAEKIIKHFKDSDISFIIEKEPLGTGGWLNLIPKINSNFIVVNGDNLFDLDWNKFISCHDKNNAIVTIALTSIQDVESKGVVEIKNERIIRFIEKPNKKEVSSNLISSGYYIFSPKVFDYVKSNKFMLEKEIFPKLAVEGRLYGYIDNSKWFDTGTFASWEDVILNWKK